jgi:glycosyltransferase involved in cell wall biosynthesis
MMWHHPGELKAVASGVVDKVLYTSEIQEAKLSPAYGAVPSYVVGNYIDPACFPYEERIGDRFTIGRLSRAAPEKFSEDFPVFYERLGLPGARFRVMAWDTELSNKYRWHTFDERWDLLPAARETQVRFLHSLNLFVYPLGHQFIESWGRSTVEAMLAGAIPIVPTGHHLEHLVADGVTGFVCFEFEEFRARVNELHSDPHLRRTMSLAGRRHAEHDLCNRRKHLAIWKEVFEAT